MHRTLLRYLPAAVVGLALSIGLCGCTKSESTTSSKSSETAPGAKKANRRCEENLDNAFSSLAPERLELSADIESTINVLNDWFASCGISDMDAAELSQAATSILSSKQQQNVLSERFTSPDAGFIRGCILTRTIAEHIADEVPDDLGRAVRAFEYTTRTVILSADGRRLPLTQYEALLFGRGSSRHQAWVLASILRQLRIDSAVLTTDAGLDSDDAPWVLGVFLDGKCYLFDFSLGTPVPSAETASEPFVSHPAHLREILERPEAIDALRAQGSSLPAPGDLKSPLVLIPASTTLLSRRMQVLQNALTGDRSYRVSERLDDAGSRKGLLSRLAGYGGDLWSPDRIRLWNYPDRQTEGFWSIGNDASLSQLLAVRKFPMKAPVEVAGFDSSQNRARVNAPANRQWKTRIEQLQFHSDDAIVGYGVVRMGRRKVDQLLKEAEELPAEAPQRNQLLADLQQWVQMHDFASDDALFWTATAQLDADSSSRAVATLTDYLRINPSGRWADAAPLLRGRAQAALGDFSAAADSLALIPENSPLRPSAQFLSSRLAEMLPAGEKPSESNAAESSGR